MSRGVNGTPAFAALVLLCLSPLFFAQSMLAQLDMPAMSLSVLALLLFLQNRFRASAIACMVLVLLKETGLVAPALLGCWLLFERRASLGYKANERAQALWFLLPLPALLLWLAALRHVTGHWFGNPAFTEYNLWEPLHPARFLIAFLRRIYYLFVGSGHFIGTAALVWALRRMPLLRSRPWRIAAAFVLAHVLVVSALGGAVLERYLLPALPIVYIAFAVSLGALLPRARQLTFGALLVCLIAANFINPLYPFPFENNLQFVNFVELQKTAASSIGARNGTVATAFPMAEALRNPDLGFVRTPRKVTAIADFTAPEIEKLKLDPPGMVIVFTRTWDPLHVLQYQFVERFLASQYGYRPELDPDAIAEELSMSIAHQWTRRGLSFTLLTR